MCRIEQIFEEATCYDPLEICQQHQWNVECKISRKNSIWIKYCEIISEFGQKAKRLIQKC